MIPVLGVDAPVVQVGIVHGAQAVTPSIHNVFHWRYGVVPGQRGSAVLSGHTCHFACAHGVFNNLGQLHKGDRVRYESGKKTVTFKVKRVRSYSAHVSAKKVASWYNPSVPSRVVLITCGDPGKDGEFHSRVVVFAKKIK